jgi:hypothetical protein
MTDSDTVTIVRSYGPRLAKRITPAGIEGYDNCKRVDLFERRIDGLADLEELLQQLAARPDCAVVRGAVADSARVRNVRRLLYADSKTGDPASLIETPRCWLALDLDGLSRPFGLDPTDLVACAKHAATVLPVSFRDVCLLVQATASHGSEHGLHLRLWCWLDRPVSGAELKFWLRSSPVDPAVFGAAQLVYTACPLFAGVADPLPSRLGVLFAAREEAAVPEPAALIPPPRKPAAQPDPVHASTYAMTMLSALAARILSAPRGSRHDTLILAARRLAELERQRLVTPEETNDLLLRAAKGAGLDDDRPDYQREVEAILQWARRA